EFRRVLFRSTLNAALDEGRAIGEDSYRRALARRDTMIAAAVEWMADVDGVIAPSTIAAAPLGLDSTGDPSCCSLASLLGAPAITLPVGKDANRLPLGMQLIAPPTEDRRLLSLALWCEERLPFEGLV